MEIICRQDAIRANKSKYFTGVPCKNGHLEERYTQSGACQGCIRPERKTDNTEKLALASGVMKRKDDLGKFVEIKVPILMADLEEFKAVLIAYAFMVNPDITIADLWLSRVPSHGVLYKVRCPVDAVEPLRTVAHRLYEKAVPKIDHIREQIIRNNLPRIETAELTIEDLRR